MKVTTILLSFLILFLSLQSCADQNVFEHEHSDEISTTHHHSDSDKDGCTPVCICNCCGIAIVKMSIDIFDLGVQDYISTKNNSNYSFAYRFSFSCKIWQPPQLIV